MRMPRYIVERTFVDGLEIPTTDEGAKTCLQVVQNNAEEQVTWVTSYVTSDRSNPTALHEHADLGGFPITAIHRLDRVIDPTTGEVGG